MQKSETRTSAPPSVTESGGTSLNPLQLLHYKHAGNPFSGMFEQASAAARHNPMQLVKKTNPGNGNAPVQRYEIKRSMENGKAYTASSDGKMVTGMGTPNHELYLLNKPDFTQINNVIAHSPLEAYIKAEVTLFEKKYYSVGLRFKTNRNKEQAKEAVSSSWFPSKVNLNAKYAENIVPKAKAFRQGLLSEKKAKVEESLPEYKALAAEVKKLTESFHLFKKIVNATLAAAGAWNDTVKGKAVLAHGFIAIVEKVLHATELNKGQAEAVKEELAGLDILGLDDNLIFTTATQVGGHLTAMVDAFPPETTVNMLDIQSLHFQESNIASLDSEDAVLLYRACDVTSATLLGNIISDDNKQYSKVYNAETQKAFHYATKVLSSGTDWISLEGFAASDIERAIAGTDKDDTTFRNVDNTWQFIMQGSAEGTDVALSKDDNFFALYTKIRYLLKGIDGDKEGVSKGVFDKQVRDRLGKPAHERNIAKGLTGDIMNAKAWEAFLKGREDPGDVPAINEQAFDDYDKKVNPVIAGYRNWDKVIAGL